MCQIFSALKRKNPKSLESTVWRERDSFQIRVPRTREGEGSWRQGLRSTLTGLRETGALKLPREEVGELSAEAPRKSVEAWRTGISWGTSVTPEADKWGPPLVLHTPKPQPLAQPWEQGQGSNPSDWCWTYLPPDKKVEIQIKLIYWKC